MDDICGISDGMIGILDQVGTIFHDCIDDWVFHYFTIINNNRYRSISMINQKMSFKIDNKVTELSIAATRVLCILDPPKDNNLLRTNVDGLLDLVIKYQE